MPKQIDNKKKAELKQHGRVIAQAMNEANIQREKNMASAAKRADTRLANAAEKEMWRNYQ